VAIVGDNLICTPTLNAYGQETVNYTIGDRGGAFSTAVVTITITSLNDVPQVEAGLDQSGSEGSLLHFAGSFTDPGMQTRPLVNDANFVIAWDFGDGGGAVGTLTPSHAYGMEGVYTVTLTVVDEQGGIGVDTLRVTVTNVAPLLAPLPDQTVKVNHVMTVTGSLSDPGWLDAHTLVIDWGDGVTETVPLAPGVTTFAVTHAYTATGQYTVHLTVRDAAGGQSSRSFTVTVQKPDYTVYLPFVLVIKNR
jgi:PKD repeat protein